MPFVPLAGIVAYESTWKPPFGEAFMKSLDGLTELQRLDFGIAAAHGCFEVDHSTKKVTIYPAERALSAFLIRFLAKLQALGTVPAIDYEVYGRALE